MWMGVLFLVYPVYHATEVNALVGSSGRGHRNAATSDPNMPATDYLKPLFNAACSATECHSAISGRRSAQRTLWIAV